MRTSGITPASAAVLDDVVEPAVTAVRYDSSAWTAATNVPPGARAPVHTLPFAHVFIYSTSVCTGVVAPVFLDEAMTQQIQQPIRADALGRWGFWAPAYNYWYKVCTAEGTLCRTGMLLNGLTPCPGAGNFLDVPAWPGPPANPSIGSLYWDTTMSALMAWEGPYGWVPIYSAIPIPVPPDSTGTANPDHLPTGNFYADPGWTDAPLEGVGQVGLSQLGDIQFLSANGDPDGQLYYRTFHEGSWGTWKLIGEGGGGGVDVISHEFILTAAGSQNFTHGLGIEYPVFSAFVKSGTLNFVLSPIDTNTISLSADAAIDVVVSFISAAENEGNLGAGGYLPISGGTLTGRLTTPELEVMAVSGVNEYPLITIGKDGTPNAAISAVQVAGEFFPDSVPGDMVFQLYAADRFIFGTGNSASTVQIAADSLRVNGDIHAHDIIFDVVTPIVATEARLPGGGGNRPGGNRPGAQAGPTPSRSLMAEMAARLPLSGGEMTGPLVLHDDPAQPDEAATKGYVDSQIAQGGTFVDAPADGELYGRKDHSWATVPTTDLSGYLPKTGGTITGTLDVQGNVHMHGSVIVDQEFNAPRIIGSYIDMRTAGTMQLQGNDIRLNSPTAVNANLSVNGNTTSAGNLNVQREVRAGYVTADAVNSTGGLTASGYAQLSGTFVQFDSQNVIINSPAGTDGVNITSPPGLKLTGPLVQTGGQVTLAGQVNMNGMVYGNNWMQVNSLQTTAYAKLEGSDIRILSHGSVHVESPGNYVSVVAPNIYLGYGGQFVGLGSNCSVDNPGNINANGNITIGGQAYKPGGGSWTATSDARLKTDVEEYDAGLEELKRLNPIRFRYNGRGRTPETGKSYVGLAAEEVKQVMPEMVGSFKGRIDYEDKEDQDILTVDPSNLIYTVINALKEIEQRLAALEEKPKRAKSHRRHRIQ
jgi:hypothetical protein